MLSGLSALVYPLPLFFFFFIVYEFIYIALPDSLGCLAKILVNAIYSVQLLSVLRKYLVIGQFGLFSFFTAFH